MKTCIYHFIFKCRSIFISLCRAGKTGHSKVLSIPKNMDYHYWTCFLLNPFIPHSHNQFQLQNQSTRLKKPNPVIYFDMIVTWIVLFIEIKKNTPKPELISPTLQGGIKKNNLIGISTTSIKLGGLGLRLIMLIWVSSWVREFFF